MRYNFLFVIVVMACSGDDGGTAQVTPDSLGWRSAHIEGPGLSFRYPVSRVRAIIDRWSPDCTAATRIYGEAPDTAVDGAIVILAAPAEFDSTASRFGFERPDLTPAVMCDEHGNCDSKGPWQLRQGDDWFAAAYADSFDVGAWRGLTGTMTMLGYFNDMPDSLRFPDDDPNAPLPKESLFQTRFFAQAPVSGACAVVISWRGAPVSEYHGGIEVASWNSVSIQTLFRSARIRESGDRN